MASFTPSAEHKISSFYDFFLHLSHKVGLSQSHLPMIPPVGPVCRYFLLLGGFKLLVFLVTPSQDHDVQILSYE